MKLFVLRIEGNAAGFPCDFIGEYVRSLRVDGPGARGTLTTTPWLKYARKFEDQAEAMEFWRQEHGVRSTDGKPNRPLTAYHVTVLPVDIDE